MILGLLQVCCLIFMGSYLPKGALAFETNEHQQKFSYWRQKIEKDLQSISQNHKQHVLAEDSLTFYKNASLESNILHHSYSVWLGSLRDLSIEKGNARSQILERVFGPPEISMSTQNRTIEARDGYQISLRVYEPKSSQKKLARILFVHGGGWTTGNIETYDRYCRYIAHSCGVSLISFNYRLAPHYPFPKPLQDVEDVYEWVLQTYPQNHLILMGDSAGGNLALALTHHQITAQKPKPKALILLYPVVDLRIPLTSGNPYDFGPFLSRRVMNTFMKNYLQKESPHNPLCSPLFSKHLDQFPLCLVVTAECDLLNPQAVSFAREMKKQKGPVWHVNFKGTCHSFAQYPGLFQEAQEAMKVIDFFVKSFEKKPMREGFL